ncbi:unnamed protein product [Vitrella brassicaformis CCMP3155]|uniref:Uncharacterized protein n=1 Tax=Vitrella brassicaformis (strain CCMP3155) TaxID=1169540 RepID=A0A0G4E9E3_VITBC|nr:unnamed protein product [Vitrella brassicaformis CCMP3155]|eukprot:CEL92211.1 unnamed protein product [Vitrella brassicaformis CCMP3155]
MEQVATEVSDVEPLVMTSIAADQVPIVAQDWSSVKSSVSTLSAAIQTIAHHISAAPPPPPSQPDTTAAADGDNAVDVTANRLPADVYCDGIVGYLPVDVAISPARAANTLFGTQLINEAFMLKRIDGFLDSNHLTGLVDVYRSMFGYYSKCAYALERGGAVWVQMTDFIHLARNYKLIKTLPLRLSPKRMGDHLASRGDFLQMPAALAIYRTFGHLLSYKGESLTLERVDEQDGADGASAEAGTAGSDQGGQHGDGGGGVTRRRYEIGDLDFVTVPLSDLPNNHPYRRTYKESDPVIRHWIYLYPSFTAFLTAMVLKHWGGQGRVEWKLVAVGLGIMAERVAQRDDSRGRIIVLKGSKATDATVAYLDMVDGNIILWTTEAPTEGRTAIERCRIRAADEGGWVVDQRLAKKVTWPAFDNPAQLALTAPMAASD